MFKKFIPILTLSLALTACGSASNDSTKTAEPSKPAETSTSAVSPATAETTTETEVVNDTEAAADTSADKDAVEGFKAYDDGEISFQYPSNWKEYDASAMNMPSLKVAFADMAPKVAFGDNVNVTAEAVTDSSASIDAIVQNTINYYEQTPAAMPDFELINSTNDIENQAAGLVGKYTQTDSGLTIMMAQVMGLRNNQLYTMTVSMSENSFNDGGQALMQTMIQSFDAK